MSMHSTAEAAERLGVSTRQVQHLVARGDLSQIARGFIDAASVDRLIAVRRGGRARAWSEATAWGAIALLSGMEASWVGESQRSRIRKRLRAMTVDSFVAQSRNRALTRRYAGHPSAVGRVRTATLSTHEAARRLGLADSAAVDAYVATDDLDQVVREHALALDDAGSFALRATTMDMNVVGRLVAEVDVVAALDLAESLDTRERSAGMNALQRALESFRD